MMTGKLLELTKSTVEIHAETGTDETLASIQSRGFWNACQRGDTDWDALTKAGFDLDFVSNTDGKVEFVTFRLKHHWRAVMQRSQ